MKNSVFKNHSGLSLLIVVLVIAAIAILLSSTAGLTGIDAVSTSVHQDMTLEAFAGADSCMEVALKNLHDNHGYIGETVTLGDTICIITIAGIGTARTVKTHSSHSLSTYTRELQAEVDWGTKYQVMSWQELTN